MQDVVSYGGVKCLHDMTGMEINIVASFRIAAMMGKAGQDPAPYIVKRLRSAALSKQLSLIVSAIGHVWPDNFQLSRPCCPRMTFDEVTVIAMLRTAGSRNRPGFDELLRDMLAEDARDFLYGLFVRLSEETAN